MNVLYISKASYFIPTDSIEIKADFSSLVTSLVTRGSS